MLGFEDKISIKNLWECVSVEKADILYTTCKKTAHLTHSLILAV